MNNSLSWSDYESVLRIAEEGSLSAAARASGQSHPTMTRHLNAIETRLGTRLFDRHRSGYLPTGTGWVILETARRMRALTLQAERQVQGQDTRPEGRVTLTTTDTLFPGLLAPIIPAFHSDYRHVMLDVRTSNRVFDLSQRDADIALRPSSSPDLNLAGQRLGVIRHAFYRPRSWTEEDANTGTVIGLSSDMPDDRFQSVLRERAMDDRVGFEVNSLIAAYQAACSGLGLALLPTYLAEGNENLMRQTEVIATMDTDLWLLVHPDLQKTARVRAVMDFLRRSTFIRKQLLVGETS